MMMPTIMAKPLDKGCTTWNVNHQTPNSRDGREAKEPHSGRSTTLIGSDRKARQCESTYPIELWSPAGAPFQIAAEVYSRL
jgi:hypothetical protein